MRIYVCLVLSCLRQ